MTEKRLSLKKNLISKFLDSAARVNDSCIIDLDQSNNKCSVVVSSADNTLILYGEITDVESTYSTSLNLPDIKKLVRVVDSISTDNITLEIEANSLQYKGKDIKFKYHLYEDGLLVKPPININKIKSFEYDIFFNITKEMLGSIIRHSTFASESNKIYLFTENGDLKCELTDRSRHNVDAISLNLGKVDFTLSPLPVNLDNIKLVNIISDNLTFNINSEFGVLVVDIVRDDIKLKYIITSLSQ